MTNPPTTSALDAAAAAFRAALLRRDEAALRRLMAAYRPAYTRMQARVDALLRQAAAARAAGQPVRPSWLVEKDRLATLQRQIIAEWARYAEVAAQVITEAQQQAVAAAVADAHALTQAALDDASASGLTVGADVTRLHPAAMRELVVVLGDGSPLKTLLDGLGAQAAQEVGDALRHAIAVGQGPRRTAQAIRAAFGGDLQRALTVARTEQMRAYRSASLQSYQENRDLLRGWQWRASLSRRTCPVCLAMDGTEHPLDEPMGTHPACRCTMVPLLRDRSTPPRETGAAWFAQQDAATQRAMLGPGKHALYQQGAITLADLVEVRNDPTWGPTLRQRSIAGAVEAAKTRAQLVPIPQSLGAAVDPRAQLRAVRVNQLAAMSDAELRAEVAAAQAAKWRETKLLEHTKKHQPDFMAALGQHLAPSDVREMSTLVAHSYDQVFTGIAHDGGVNYVFVSQWKQGNAIMVLTIARDGIIRSFFPLSNLPQYLGRNIDLIEVTHRVSSTP